MFACGPVDNFLCKFTDQSEFMSAILRKRVEPLLNLPQVQQSSNRHEVELSQLRYTFGLQITTKLKILTLMNRTDHNKIHLF